MIVGITGSRGFVGSSLARLAVADGHVVRYLDRPIFSLEEGVPEAWLRDVDLLVHCAFDFHDMNKNISGSRMLFTQAKHAGVGTSVLISSLSKDSGSRYGRTKKSVERLATILGVKIVRPGLIYDTVPGGILGRIVRVARYVPVLPIIADSEQFTTHIEDLYQAILSAPKAKGVIVAAAEQPVKLEKVISHFVGRRAFIPIPFGFFYGVLRVLEKLPLGVSSDNLVGLHHLPKPEFGETKRLGLTFRDF